VSALAAGDALEPQTYAVTRDDLVAYAAASGDQNPIHQDEQVALAVGLPGVIAHGMYTMALAARAVATWTDGAEVLELGCRFTNPVVVPADGGAEIRVAGTVKSFDDGRLTLALEVTHAGPEGPVKVLGNPRAVVRADGA
jgi:acyl dehydratase